MRCKQTIKLLLQMVNTAKIKISIENCCLKNFQARCLQHSNNLLTLRLTMHNNTNKVKLFIINKHSNNFFAIDKSHCKQSQQPINSINKLFTTFKQSQQPINSINKDNIFANNLSNLSTASTRIISLQTFSTTFYFVNNINKDIILANNLNKIHTNNLHTANKQLTESFIITTSSTI